MKLLSHSTLTPTEFQLRVRALAERFACSLLASPQSEYLCGKPERLGVMSVLMAYQYADAAESKIEELFACMMTNGAKKDPVTDPPAPAPHPYGL